MKTNQNISDITESAEDSEGFLLALKSALNPEDLISDDLWFSWSKRLAEFPFSSELVGKVAGKNRLPWPAARKFATFDDYLGMPLKKISKIIGRTSLRTLILCVASAELNLIPKIEAESPMFTKVDYEEVTFEKFYKFDYALDLISSETWDEWTGLLLESADRKRFISDIVDELGGLFWQARWKNEKISDYCRFSLDKIRAITPLGKNTTIVKCVAKVATDYIAKLNTGDRKNLIQISFDITPPALPKTPTSSKPKSTISDSTDINSYFPKQLLLSPDSTDFHSNFDSIIIDNLSTQPRRPDPDSFWIPQGQTITTGGYSGYCNSDGFVYVGSSLKSVHGKSKEPSLIDDSLAIGSAQPDHRGKYLNSNSYSRIFAPCRADYKKWLSTGRKDPNAYIGYVLLYFYGLERRVLADAKDSASARSEVPAIFSEVKRLLSIYGEDVSFHKYAVQFLDFIFKIALSPNSDGSFTLSAEWALACAENDLSMPRRMSVQRCPDEFRELCKIRYNEKYGEGITLLPNKKCFRAAYVPASPSFRGLVELPDQHWPYMEEFSELASQLLILVTNCADELEAYSNYLAKNTHGKNSIVAISFLPVTLLKKQFGEEFQLLIKKLEEHISPVDVVSLPFSSLLPKINQDGLGEEDVADFASLFSLFNVGIEPDGSFSLSAEWALAYVENDLSMPPAFPA